MKIRTRFAPSPTGYLHIGGFRTALYNYLFAKASGGEFYLRIEDTDMKRNSDAAAKAIVDAFAWTGLHHDGEIIYQSRRMDIYKKYIKQLLDEKKAYYCYTTKEELDLLRDTQAKQGLRPKYDGKYRDFSGTPPADIQPVVRIKAPLEGEICVKDGVKGDVVFKAGDILDDFIIARADGTPTYNFVVVIDDALMGITHIIRGDDHLSNTPKQIVLYEALGFKIPHFFHVAMVNGEDGKKLSKRHGAVDVMEYQRAGVLPEALINFLVRLGWSFGDEEVFSLAKLEEIFDPFRLSKSASTYNASKLEWLNAHYIKTLPFGVINHHTRELGFDFEQNEALCNLLRERCKDLNELINGAKSLLIPPASYDEKGVKKNVKQASVDILQDFLASFLPCKDAKSYEDFTKDFLEKKGLKLKDLAQLLRLGITGRTVSPSIFEVLILLDFDDILARLERFLAFIKTLEFDK